MRKAPLMSVFVILIAGCSSSDRCEPPREIMLYANQVMYFYEDPTENRLKQAIEYRGRAIKLMFKECDASAYKHAVGLDSAFFGLVNEKYGYTIPPKEELDGIEWKAKEILNRKVSYAGDLDYIWAAYFATGEAKWIDLIALHINNPDLSIARSAKWSCNANYRQHREIKIYVDRNKDIKKLIVEKSANLQESSATSK